MRKRISLEKVTKFIVDGWLGDGPDWNKRGPHNENHQTQPDPAQSPVASQRGKPARKFLRQVAPAGWHGFRKSAENSD
jgi:hypothetical protein